MDVQDKKQIKVLVFAEGDYLVAQCLEYDIAVQARAIHKLQERLERTLLAHVYLAKEHGEVPFENFKQAPAEYWRQWELSSGKVLERIILKWPELEWEKCEALPQEAELVLA